jgi:hypothetical protein
VQLHIEELVLHGFSHNDRYRIADALQRELHRRLEERGITPRVENSAVSKLDAGSFQVRSNERADTVGLRVAQAVYEKLKKEL